MPSLNEFVDDISAIYKKATDPADTPMTIINDTAWGEFKGGDYIVGEKSNAKAKIIKEKGYNSCKITDK